MMKACSVGYRPTTRTFSTRNAPGAALVTATFSRSSTGVGRKRLEDCSPCPLRGSKMRRSRGSQFQALRKRVFPKAQKRVIDDRNQNIAHPFEFGQKGAKPAAPTEIEDAVHPYQAGNQVRRHRSSSHPGRGQQQESRRGRLSFGAASALVGRTRGGLREPYERRSRRSPHAGTELTHFLGG